MFSRGLITISSAKPRERSLPVSLTLDSRFLRRPIEPLSETFLLFLQLAAYSYEDMILKSRYRCLYHYRLSIAIVLLLLLKGLKKHLQPSNALCLFCDLF